MTDKKFLNKQDFLKRATEEDYETLKNIYTSLKRKDDFNIQYYDIYGFKVDCCRMILEDKKLIDVKKRNKPKETKNELHFNFKEKVIYKNRTIPLSDEVYKKLDEFCEQYQGLNKNIIIDTLIKQAIDIFSDEN